MMPNPSTAWTRKGLNVLRRVRRMILGISPREARVSRRGFRCTDASVADRLERIGRTFIAGTDAALAAGDPEAVSSSLDAIDMNLELRGFAFEGAAMAFALLDRLLPWGRRGDRWRRFLEGAGAPHAYMVHVGAGWARARLGGRTDSWLADADPLLRWLVVDGWGFHEGYFHFPRRVDAHEVPRGLAGYAVRAFDQGLGRSLWFVEGASSERIARTIGGFTAARRSDLWSGVGLACAYAGGVDRAAVLALLEASGSHAVALAQGVAFAATARSRAGNAAPCTDLACEVLVGTSASDAVRATLDAARDLPPDGAEPAYEAWRRRVRERFARVEAR